MKIQYSIYLPIRENLRNADSKTNITDLVNDAVTNTFTRTINTSLTTFIMLFTLFIFGVTSVREFALPLMVGVVCGAYASVCITSALWYVMGGKKRGVIEEEKKKVAPKVDRDGAQI